MVNINLLPWREQELKYQKKMLGRMFVLTAMSGIIIIVVMHIILAQQENILRARINAGNETLTKTHSQSEVAAANPLPDIILIGKIFSALESTSQAMICFTEIKNEQQSVLFKGKTQSMQDLTQYFLHWKAKALFTDLNIKQISQQENGMLEFALEAKK